MLITEERESINLFEQIIQQGKIRQIRMLQRKTHLIRIQKKIILLYQIKIQPMKKMIKIISNVM